MSQKQARCIRQLQKRVEILETSFALGSPTKKGLFERIFDIIIYRMVKKLEVKKKDGRRKL